jgi:hypothetical protein
MAEENPKSKVLRNFIGCFIWALLTYPIYFGITKIELITDQSLQCIALTGSVMATALLGGLVIKLADLLSEGGATSPVPTTEPPGQTTPAELPRQPVAPSPAPLDDFDEEDEEERVTHREPARAY